MSYVITDACVGACEMACVQVCPVDAIHGAVPERELSVLAPAQRAQRYPSLQLYIDPDTCTSCGACESECPANAIFDEDDLPEDKRWCRDENARFFAQQPQP